MVNGSDAVISAHRSRQAHHTVRPCLRDATPRRQPLPYHESTHPSSTRGTSPHVASSMARASCGRRPEKSRSHKSECARTMRSRQRCNSRPPAHDPAFPCIANMAHTYHLCFCVNPHLASAAHRPCCRFQSLFCVCRAGRRVDDRMKNLAARWEQERATVSRINTHPTCSLLPRTAVISSGGSVLV